MKKVLWFFVVTGILFGATSLPAQIYVHPVSSSYHRYDLDIDVWTDQPEGSVYYPNEEIQIYFRANRDCYVTLYNIDTEGRINRIWPMHRHDDNHVRGHRTYRVPDRRDDYELRVSGPAGIEYIQAVASYYPYDVPEFHYREPAHFDYWDDDWDVSFGFIHGDPYLAIEKVNRYCVPRSHWDRSTVATDMTHFYVDYYVYYPGYMCNDCHYRGSRFGVSFHFDPYFDVCGGYIFYIDDDWRAPVHNSYHHQPRYRYKKRSGRDRAHYYDNHHPDGRYKGQPGDSNYGRYKSGYGNVNTVPKEDPPAKYISSRGDRDRFKDAKPEDKYDAASQEIRPDDRVTTTRFKQAPIPKDYKPALREQESREKPTQQESREDYRKPKQNREKYRSYDDEDDSRKKPAEYDPAPKPDARDELQRSPRHDLKSPKSTAPSAPRYKSDKYESKKEPDDAKKVEEKKKSQERKRSHQEADEKDEDEKDEPKQTEKKSSSKSTKKSYSKPMDQAGSTSDNDRDSRKKSGK